MNTQYSDFHLHSEFSDDSNTPMEQQIERAIECGLKEICFTDHVDYGIKKDWTEDDIPVRTGTGFVTREEERALLANVNYPEYFWKLYRMRKMYGSRITIRAGLEFGIQTQTLPRFRKLVSEWGNELDFILMSFHQIDGLELWNGSFMEGKTQLAYNLRYYEEMLAVAETFDDFDVLAHVDLISRYDKKGPLPFGDAKDILTKIFNTVISKGKGIEINTSSWHYGLKDTTPAVDILKLYRSLGGTVITIGSDAHRPEYVADHFDDAGRILKECGFTHAYTFEKHKPVPYAI